MSETAESGRAGAGGMRPFADARLAFRFLTRFPVPSPAPRGGGSPGTSPVGTAFPERGDLGRSCAWFPLAGAAMGLVLAGGLALAQGHAPAPLAGALAAAALAFMSGGLHLDGLADLFDGLSGGHGDRARILAIMRDARIGAHGAAALFVVLLVKAAALCELFLRGDPWTIVAAPAVARFAVVPLVVYLPYAREEGLGRAFRGTAGTREVVVAALLAAATLAPSAPRSLAAAAVALAVAAALALRVNRRLGGLTGDVYGAAIELAELAFLSVAALR